MAAQFSHKKRSDQGSDAIGTVYDSFKIPIRYLFLVDMKFDGIDIGPDCTFMPLGGSDVFPSSQFEVFIELDGFYL